MSHPLEEAITTTGRYKAYVEGYNDARQGKAPTRPPSRGVVFLRQVGAALLWAMTIATFIALVLYLVAQFDNVPPMRIIKTDLHVSTAPDGRSFFVNRTTCMDRMVPAEGLPRLVGTESQILIPLPQKPLSAVPGCHDYSILVLIPEEVPPGEYWYRITYRFRMNAFKSMDVEAPTVGVTVVK